MTETKLTTIVEQVMTKDVVTMALDEPISKAARLMLDARIHGVVVLDAGEPKHVISSFDILHVAYGEFLSEDWDFLHTPVKRLVSELKLVAITPNAPLSEALTLFVRHNIRILPVIESGQLLGVLSLMDIARLLEHGR